MTKEIKKAMAHVRKSHPTVSIVVFSKDARWQYMDENFKPFVFGKEIDPYILEQAVDSAPTLPYVYQK